MSIFKVLRIKILIRNPRLSTWCDGADGDSSLPFAAHIRIPCLQNILMYITLIWRYDMETTDDKSQSDQMIFPNGQKVAGGLDWQLMFVDGAKRDALFRILREAVTREHQAGVEETKDISKNIGEQNDRRL
ncbi:hypothetical protein HY772_09325 [Candidatus Woesearchaeota archaeon]|nr:hypothetical protein [Candidatus Woesearchaeota archaeon]